MSFLAALPEGVVAGWQMTSAKDAALALGVPEVDAVLPDGGLPQGQVTELSAAQSSGLSTSLALQACAAAQSSRGVGAACTWAAFIDSTASLYAPGVRQAGVDLEHLFVVRPPKAAVSRTAVKLAEARSFSVIAIDLMREASAGLNASQWNRAIRRLSLAVQGTQTVVLMLTSLERRPSDTLPVGLRLELQRLGQHELSIKVAKDKRGRLSAEQRVQWQGYSASESSSLARLRKTARQDPVLATCRGNEQSKRPSTALQSGLWSVSA